MACSRASSGCVVRVGRAGGDERRHCAVTVEGDPSVGELGAGVLGPGEIRLAPDGEVDAVKVELHSVLAEGGVVGKDAVERVVTFPPYRFGRDEVGVERFHEDVGVDVRIGPGRAGGDAAEGDDGLHGRMGLPSCGR